MDLTSALFPRPAVRPPGLPVDDAAPDEADGHLEARAIRDSAGELLAYVAPIVTMEDGREIGRGWCWVVPGFASGIEPDELSARGAAEEALDQRPTAATAGDQGRLQAQVRRQAARIAQLEGQVAALDVRLAALERGRPPTR